MARKLKTYLTSIGFFDQAVAAPSMKAALQAWGADSNLFHQGFAAEIDDPDIVEATMAHPGVVLKRPVGSKQPFKLSADLPKQLTSSGAKPRTAKAPRKQRAAKGDPRVDARKNTMSERKAALAFEKEQRRRAQQQKKEAVARARRERLIASAQAALDKAEQEHLKRAGVIETERAAVENKAQAEEERWEGQRRKLENAVRRARS
jgi:hypothetical protein